MNVEIVDIRKNYGRKNVLGGVSFSAQSGSCVGILGANGSGKSTLLRILAGVLRPDGGSILWQGTDLLRKPDALAATVAYVPQGTPLMEELTARDNLRLWYETERMEQSLESGVLRELGIHDFLRTPVYKLSGGMKKRLSIGCAVHAQPSILLLDEPTAALDLVCKERILAYFDHFCREGGLTILATHDQREVERCDRWLILQGGMVEPYDYDGNLQGLAQRLEES